MTKKEFIALYAEKANFEKKVDAEKKLDTVLNLFEEILIKGDEINFVGWGKFEVKDKDLSILVVGLGNREVTPDSLGPCVADHLSVTRHIVKEYGKLSGLVYAAGKLELLPIKGLDIESIDSLYNVNFKSLLYLSSQ